MSQGLVFPVSSVMLDRINDYRHAPAGTLRSADAVDPVAVRIVAEAFAGFADAPGQLATGPSEGVSGR